MSEIHTDSIPDHILAKASDFEACRSVDGLDIFKFRPSGEFSLEPDARAERWPTLDELFKHLGKDKAE